jgi:tripartite-type tricarboxylate transporter receptor subunit TctC
VPTIAEGRLPGYELTSWYALMGPGGMPSRNRRQAQRRRAQGNRECPTCASGCSTAGSEPEVNTPEQMAAMVKRTSRSSARIIRTAGIKVD